MDILEFILELLKNFFKSGDIAVFAVVGLALFLFDRYIKLKQDKNVILYDEKFKNIEEKLDKAIYQNEGIAKNLDNFNLLADNIGVYKKLYDAYENSKDVYEYIQKELYLCKEFITEIHNSISVKKDRIDSYKSVFRKAKVKMMEALGRSTATDIHKEKIEYFINYLIEKLVAFVKDIQDINDERMINRLTDAKVDDLKILINKFKTRLVSLDKLDQLEIEEKLEQFEKEEADDYECFITPSKDNKKEDNKSNVIKF
jgi:hypothetical protein